MVACESVYFVGAGPGDPELLTLKARRLLKEADVVVYDRLVCDEIIGKIPPGTAKIVVGEGGEPNPLPREGVIDLLVRLARTGRKIVRLKLGDPLTFGGGGEEAMGLMRRGIAFEVVPGIGAASSCAATLGIPLAHPGLATGIKFVSAQTRDFKPLELDWRRLADPNTTLVIHVDLANLPRLSERLIRAGLPPGTPAAAITNGATASQRLCISSLALLPRRIQMLAWHTPVLVVIGNVIRMAGIDDRETDIPARHGQGEAAVSSAS